MIMVISVWTLAGSHAQLSFAFAFDAIILTICILNIAPILVLVAVNHVRQFQLLTCGIAGMVQQPSETFLMFAASA